MRNQQSSASATVAYVAEISLHALLSFIMCVCVYYTVHSIKSKLECYLSCHVFPHFQSASFGAKMTRRASRYD